MRFVNLNNCKPGMIIARDIFSQNGITLLCAGSELRPTYLETLKKLGYKGCYIEDDISKDIKMKEAVSITVRNEAAILLYETFSKARFGQNTIQKHLLNSINDILDDVVDQIMRNRDSVVNVMSLKTFDQYTYQHSVDVAVLAVYMGKEMNLVRSQLIELGKASFFHDIGKMFVNQAVLNKPGSLTPIEFEEVKKHPQLGYDFLKDTMGMSDKICEAALYHHERFDGNGYPTKKEGLKIPLFARIIAVADTFDAITSKRPYKEAAIPSEAYEYIMASASTQFDPEIVNVFVKKIAPFPVGVTVMLSDGREGIVQDNNEHFMMRPIIKLLEPDLTKSNDNSIDLSDPDNIDITIVQML